VLTASAYLVIAKQIWSALHNTQDTYIPNSTYWDSVKSILWLGDIYVSILHTQQTLLSLPVNRDQLHRQPYNNSQLSPLLSLCVGEIQPGEELCKKTTCQRHSLHANINGRLQNQPEWETIQFNLSYYWKCRQIFWVTSLFSTITSSQTGNVWVLIQQDVLEF